ncbi:MAG TPA: AAA family ATPase [Microvirga sp.]|jgi:predicted ABC-type ATPase|nr:AAA family ATPase [Microvirga sp.]
MPNGQPTFWLITGPDGVGKTTYAIMRHLRAVSGSINFVNLDEIARGLPPLEPSAAQTEAARIALSRARFFMRERATFAMVTTLSGQSHLHLLGEAADAGLSTAMLYSSVRDPAICLERIARRVAEGGHDVPEPVVRRRFARGLANLPAYARICELWRVYEASGPRPALALEDAGSDIRHRDDDVLAQGHPSLAGLSS